jgi:hypothetical protein
MTPMATEATAAAVVEAVVIGVAGKGIAVVVV